MKFSLSIFVCALTSMFALKTHAFIPGIDDYKFGTRYDRHLLKSMKEQGLSVYKGRSGYLYRNGSFYDSECAVGVRKISKSLIQVAVVLPYRVMSGVTRSELLNPSFLSRIKPKVFNYVYRGKGDYDYSVQSTPLGLRKGRVWQGLRYSSTGLMSLGTWTADMSFGCIVDLSKDPGE